MNKNSIIKGTKKISRDLLSDRNYVIIYIFPKKQEMARNGTFSGA